MSETPSTDIIREAEAVSELSVNEWREQGWIQDSVVTTALRILLDNGYADDQCGSVDGPNGHCARIDRWHINTDIEGKNWSAEYTTEDESKLAFEAIARDLTIEWCEEAGCPKDQCVGCDH